MNTTTDLGRPRAWTAEQVRNDTSWVLRLTSEQIDGLNAALEHAKAVGKPMLDMEQADFPLNAAAQSALRRAVAATQGRWGFVLVKGFPVDRWSEQDARLAYWGMGLYMGVARTQNRASDFMNDVRNAGGEYKVKGGRGYNTNAGLDFHIDSTDVVSLLCRRTARTGGASKVVSSIALRDEVARLRPDLLAVLHQPFFFSYQGAQDPSQPPFYRCPIFTSYEQYVCVRVNRKNIMAAQRDFPEVPRLTQAQVEALDLLEQLMASDELCYNMQLERGDLQMLNSYVTAHSRTAFEDYDDPDQKRHLFRLWLAVPGSQPLSPEWEELFIDGRAGAVRGGFRGSAITPEFLAFEQRQARAMGMLYRPWTPSVRKEDVAELLEV